MMKKYTKKPATVEAIQWDGKYSTFLEMASPTARMSGGEFAPLHIETLEGVVGANIGDWIIKRGNGEFYSCEPDIFEATYTEADGV